MGIGHVFQLEMRRLCVILDDVDAFDTKQHERKKQDVEELNSKKQNTQGCPFFIFFNARLAA